jgi:hypothetical protein
MSMIYSLVSRGHETVLANYTNFAGNFQNIAMDVVLNIFRFLKNAILGRLLDNTELQTIIFILT